MRQRTSGQRPRKFGCGQKEVLAKGDRSLEAGDADVCVDVRLTVALSNGLALQKRHCLGIVRVLAIDL